METIGLYKFVECCQSHCFAISNNLRTDRQFRAVMETPSNFSIRVANLDRPIPLGECK